MPRLLKPRSNYGIPSHTYFGSLQKKVAVARDPAVQFQRFILVLLLFVLRVLGTTFDGNQSGSKKQIVLELLGQPRFVATSNRTEKVCSV